MKEQKKQHVHKKLIIEWANGHPIQVYKAGVGWVDVKRPKWSGRCNYRLRPTEASVAMEKADIIKQMEKLTKRMEELDTRRDL